MSTQFYKINQTLSNGEQVNPSCEVLPLAGTHKVKVQLSNGQWLDAGSYEADTLSASGTMHVMEVTLSDGTVHNAYFKSHFGLYKPVVSDFSWTRDIYTNANWGQFKVRNNNDLPVVCSVWWKASNSSVTGAFTAYTLQPGEVNHININEIYSGGICVRVHFSVADKGIFENEVFTTFTLGSYSGDLSFGGVDDVEDEESTSTTTTTTTPASLSAEPTPIDSDGKFTLWRVQDGK